MFVLPLNLIELYGEGNINDNFELSKLILLTFILTFSKLPSTVKSALLLCTQMVFTFTLLKKINFDKDHLYCSQSKKFVTEVPSVNTKLKLAFQTVPFKFVILIGLEFILLTNEKIFAGAKRIIEIKNKIKKKIS